MLARLKLLMVLFRDPDKKNTIQMIMECIHFGIIKKTLPLDYFRKFLYRKGVKNYLDFLSLKQYYSIIESKKMVFPEISALLHHKLSFKLVAQKQELPVTPMLGYNLKNQFAVNNKLVSVNNVETLYKILKDLVDKNDIDKIFVKPMSGIGGAGCFILTKDNIKNTLKDRFFDIIQNCYLFEEYIQQHPAIGKIHPSAINTLRIVHYIDKNQEVHILSSLIRFGVGNSFTDNISSGGFSVAINSLTGKLEGPGRQNVAKGGAVYYKHPDTQYQLEGFGIPYYQEACELVKHAAYHFPNRIVGWDIAITDSGPVIIEANHNVSLHLSDIAYGGYMKHPLIKEILNEINN